VAIALTRRRFTVDEYERMAEVGILCADDRLELIDGEIVEMTPIGSRHAGRVFRLTSLFTSRLGERAIVGVQGPIRLSADSQVQPDIVLLRPRPDFYTESHAGPADVLLVVEVADTSLRADRHVKLPLYARSGIPEVWLLDLTEHMLTVYRRPGSLAYEEERTLRPADRLSPETFPDLVLAPADLLG